MDESMFDWGSWYDGDSFDISDGDTLYDYGDYSDYGDGMWNVSDVDANAEWTDYAPSDDYTYGGDAAAGGSGGSINWGALMGYGAQAAGGYMENAAKGKMSKEQLELMSKLKKEEYAFQLAEQEKYRQLKNQEIKDAYKAYEGYYKNPNDPANAMNNPTNIFGLLTPRPTTGPLANGW